MVFLLRLDKVSEHSYFGISVLIEVKAIVFGLFKLHEVVIKRFLANADYPCCFVKTLLDDCAIFSLYAIVKLPPLLDCINHLFERSFLYSLS